MFNSKKFRFSIIFILIIFSVNLLYSKDYTVVAGAFKNRVYAEKHASNIGDKGYLVQVLQMQTRKGELYRVCVGIENKWKDAVKLKDKLEKEVGQTNMWILKHDFNIPAESVAKTDVNEELEKKKVNTTKQETKIIVKKSDESIANTVDKTPENTTITITNEKIVENKSKPKSIKDAEPQQKIDANKDDEEKANKTTEFKGSVEKEVQPKSIKDAEPQQKIDANKDDEKKANKITEFKGTVEKEVQPKSIKETEPQQKIDANKDDEKKANKITEFKGSVEKEVQPKTTQEPIDLSKLNLPKRDHKPKNIKLQEYLRAFKVIINSFERKDHERMSKYIHPEFGFLVLTENKGKNEAIQLMSSNDFYELDFVKNNNQVIMNDLKTSRLTIPKVGSLPAYDCERKKYNGVGLYTANIEPDKSEEINFTENKNGIIFKSYTEISDFEAINTDNKVIYGYYFSKIGDNWYLSMINLLEPCK